jgi:hypothetical protein
MSITFAQRWVYMTPWSSEKWRASFFGRAIADPPALGMFVPQAMSASAVAEDPE